MTKTLQNFIARVLEENAVPMDYMGKGMVNMTNAIRTPVHPTKVLEELHQYIEEYDDVPEVTLPKALRYDTLGRLYVIY